MVCDQIIDMWTINIEAMQSLQRKILQFEEASGLAKSIQEKLHGTKEDDSKVQESNLTGN